MCHNIWKYLIASNAFLVSNGNFIQKNSLQKLPNTCSRVNPSKCIRLILFQSFHANYIHLHLDFKIYNAFYVA